MASHNSRRQFIKAVSLTGAAGLSTLSGCLGGIGGIGGPTTITIQSGSEQGTAFAIVSALQKVVSEQSDSVEVVNQVGPAYSANLRAYDAGEVNGLVTDMISLDSALNDSGAFSDRGIDKIPYQGFRISNLYMYFVKREGLDDIQSTADLPGKAVWPTPPPFGTRVPAEGVLKRSGYWDEIDVVNLGPGDITGGLAEGRVDVAVIYANNQVDIPGWAKNVDAQVEVEYVPMDDAIIDAIDDWEALKYFEVPPFGWEQTLNTDMLETWAFQTQIFFSDDLGEDPVYEVAKISSEQVDDLKSVTPGYPDHSDPQTMIDAMRADVPIHPGTAKLYEELGVWDSSWQVGSV